jgi:hypothetical protein
MGLLVEVASIVTMVVVLIFLFLSMIVTFIIGTQIAGFFHFHGILWWVCSLLFMSLIFSILLTVKGNVGVE